MAKFEKNDPRINRNGRPKKDRALTAILEAAGNKTVKTGDGKKVAKKRLMADMLWQAVTNGEIELPNGKTVELTPADMLDIMQFIYKHVDGPPVQKIAPTDPSGENPYMSLDAETMREIARSVLNAGDAPEE